MATATEILQWTIPTLMYCIVIVGAVGVLRTMLEGELHNARSSQAEATHRGSE